MIQTKPIALLVTPVLPLPNGSGRALRAWDWLLTLSHNHRVHVVLAAMPGEVVIVPADYLAEAVWNLAGEVSHPSRANRALGLICPVLALHSRHFMADWIHPSADSAVFQALMTKLRDEAVMHIVVFRLGLHDVAQPLLRRWPDARAELDVDDVESVTRLSVAASLLRLGRIREGIRSAVIALQYRFVERFAFGSYHTAWLASPNDCAGFVTRLSQHIDCRPNRISVVPMVPRRSESATLNLLFVGTLNYPPNEEAIRFLLRRVVPQLQREALKWRMTIVGRHATDDIRQLAEQCPETTLLADAENIGICYSTADIALIPVRAGGGTKLKTLEAFAYGLPVISTMHGVRGLGAAADKHFLLAETSAQFTQAITRLAVDRSFAARVGKAGNELWRKNFRVL